MATLSEAERAAIVQCYHNDLTHEEAAYVLELPGRHRQDAHAAGQAEAQAAPGRLGPRTGRHRMNTDPTMHRPAARPADWLDAALAARRRDAPRRVSRRRRLHRARDGGAARARRRCRRGASPRCRCCGPAPDWGRRWRCRPRSTDVARELFRLVGAHPVSLLGDRPPAIAVAGRDQLGRRGVGAARRTDRAGRRKRRGRPCGGRAVVCVRRRRPGGHSSFSVKLNSHLGRRTSRPRRGTSSPDSGS